MFLLLIASCMVTAVTGYSTGAAEAACSNILNPLHDGALKQNTTCPYKVSVDVSENEGLIYGGGNISGG